VDGTLTRTSPSPRDRVEGLLDALRGRLPYAAALVTAHDPKVGRHVTVSNRGYPGEVVDYVLDTYIPCDPSFRLAMAHPEEVLHWDTLPHFRRGAMAREYLLPSGYRQGSSLVLGDRSGRPVGTLHVSLHEELVDAGTVDLLGSARRTAVPLVAAENARLGTSLSARELEVLRHMCAGRGNAEIAAELWVTRRTVATHVEHILRKMGAGNRVQAAVRAIALGLVSPYEEFELDQA